jgi:hypothetical protein
MAHRRLEDILSRASTETDGSSENDPIPSIEESDDTSKNFSSDPSARDDDSISSDQVSKDSDSGNLPGGESLKGILSKLWEVSELVGENDNDPLILPDVAEFAEIDLAQSEAFTS